MNTAVLRLNAAMVPVGVCAARDAFKAMCEDGAHSVLDTPRFAHTPSLAIPIPAVIRFPGMTFLPPRRVNFTRLNVLYRDDLRCQYCGGRFRVDELQLEHVIPQSRFAAIAARRGIRYGKDSWENCVAACVACNAQKRDRMPEEAGMKLIRQPKEPAFRAYVTIKRCVAERRGWMPFLEHFENFAVSFLS